MPAYLHIAEPQEIRQEEERKKQLREELEKCTQVKGTFRNKIYRFLVDSGIRHLKEIDYPLRSQFKAYANTLMFLKYLPDREIAEKYTIAREESHLLWDFRIACPETLKQQIFRAVCSISREKQDSGERKLALTGLQYLYRFCICSAISDIELSLIHI